MRARILVIEDSPAQGARIRQILEGKAYEVVLAGSGTEGLRLARADQPDVILLDVVMADMDGFAVCRWLKLTEDTRDIPIVMLTVRSEVADRVEGLNVGADDYLPKPFAEEELEARIFAALRAKVKAAQLRRRADELEGMLREVEALSVMDPLTGLFNRRRFEDLLRRELKVTQRYKNPLSCMLIDVDRFKSVNDELGRGAGDEVLKDVSMLLGRTLREVDHVARIGGEEFAILTPHTPKQASAVAAERICKLIAGFEFRPAGTPRSITASFGVADTSDVSPADPTALVRAADAALLRAKREGRNRVAVYNAELDGSNALIPGDPVEE